MNSRSSRASGARQNAERVSSAYKATQSLFQEHKDFVHALHADMMNHVAQELSETHSYTDAELKLALEFLDDIVMTFRFARRAGFEMDIARSMLIKTVQWRLEGGIDALAQDMLHSPYMDATSNGVPLLWGHSRFRDRLGRPCLYVRLQHVERTPDGLRELKKSVIAALDIMRRYLLRVNRRTKQGDPVIQCVTLIDVMEAGLSNVELDMLPFLIDLLKNHYPGMSGAVYVLRYSWFHAGLWRMLRPILPPKLLERLFFVDAPELLAHFDHHVPQCLGGPLPVSIAPDTSDVFNYFVRAAVWAHERPNEHVTGVIASTTASEACVSTKMPARSARGDPVPPSLWIRHQDFGTIYDVMSRYGSPYTSMTPLTPHTSVPPTPRLRPQSSSPSLQLRDLPMSPEAYKWKQKTHHEPPAVPNAYHTRDTRPWSSLLLSWLPIWLYGKRTDGTSFSDATDLIPAEPRIVSSKCTSSKNAEEHAPPEASALLPSEGSTPAPKALTSSTNFAATVPPSSVNATDESNSVTRYLSRRAHMYAEMEGHVSPYNIENPYFGYPASYVNEQGSIGLDMSKSGARPAGFSRELHVRRRKRDLVRTLTYLFVLRLVRLYRWIRRSIYVVVWNVLGPRRAWASLGHIAAGKHPSHYIRRRVLLFLLAILYFQVPHKHIFSRREQAPSYRAIM